MTITFTKARNITRFTRYTVYTVLRDGIIVGYVENRKSGPYNNWQPFHADGKTPAHPCVHSTRKDATQHLMNALEDS